MSALAAPPSGLESPQEHGFTTAVLASGRTLIHERMSGTASHQPLLRAVSPSYIDIVTQNVSLIQLQIGSYGILSRLLLRSIAGPSPGAWRTCIAYR
jgi:hypothetical protein